MNESLTIRALERVMKWDDEAIVKEMTWLRLMSQFKYDSYRDYLGGVRFSECLIDWLQQFQQEDRQAAYDYIRQQLIFISYPEMQHLVNWFFPACVEPILASSVAARLSVPQYLLWSRETAAGEFELALRKTLFVGLSDGARMDMLRRANEKRISNEQVLVTTQVNESKWQDVLKELRKDVKDNAAQFSRVFLVDDFVGSGKTLLRREENGTWTGKLKKFRDEHPGIFATHFEANWTLHVHHYVCSHEASERVRTTAAEAQKELGPGWFDNVAFSYGLILPESVRLDPNRDSAFWDGTEKYYDAAIETDAIRVGGKTAKRGFGECGLPLILEHNTPNNSVALLWAESNGEKGHPMRPLFRRAERHW
jgi:hypothetical protein